MSNSDFHFKLLALAFLIASSCKPSPERVDNPEEALIRAAREFSNKAIAQKDTAALASVWAPDFHVISSRNSEMSGRTANRDRFAADFTTRPDVLYVRTPDTIEVFEKWNMAAETGHWVGHWTDNGSFIELSGTYFAKWHKINGQWLIRGEIFVPLKCSGGKFCDQSPI